MEILLFLILIVLIAGLFPGLLSNIGTAIVFILMFGIFYAAWGWTGLALIIGIPSAIAIYDVFFSDPNKQKQSADDIIQKIRERAEGPEGNIKEYE